MTTNTAFQPPQARGGMMKVAGAEDVREPGEELLVDGDPVINEGLLKAFINEVIRRQDGKYVLYTKHRKGGKRRRLGTHGSKASAKRQERAIHAHGG